MAVEFYELNDTKRQNLLFSIEPNDFDLLEVVFDILTKKTGISLNPYGNTRLYQKHVELIISELRYYLTSQSASLDQKRKTIYKQTLENFLLIKDGFFAVGD